MFVHFSALRDPTDCGQMDYTGCLSNITHREDVWIGLNPFFPLWANITTNKYRDIQKTQDGTVLNALSIYIDVNRKSKTIDCDRDTAPTTAA